MEVKMNTRNDSYAHLPTNTSQIIYTKAKPQYYINTIIASNKFGYLIFAINRFNRVDF